MRPAECSSAIARELPAASPRPRAPSEEAAAECEEERPQSLTSSEGEAAGDRPEGGGSSASTAAKTALLGSEVHKDKLEMLRRETRDVQEVLEQRKTRRSRRKSRRLAIESNVDRLFPLIATVLLDYKD